MKDFFIYLLCGVVSGVLGGMGMGGGTLLIPILTIFCNVNQHIAQEANLVSFIPMAIIASAIHLKNGFVKKEGIIEIVVPALIFAVGAGILAKSINGDVLQKIFGGFLLLTAVFAFFADKINFKKKK